MRLSPSRLVAALASLVLVVVVALLIGYGSAAAPAGANAGDDVAHGFLVSETPTSGWPKILGTPTYVEEGDGFELGVELSREVFAAAEVGNTIVLGGNFHNIERTNGAIVEQRYLVAFDRATGALVPGFDPDVSGEVLALHADPDGVHVYVGGRFNTINGLTRRKMARINVQTGAVDTSFLANADAAVNTIDVTTDGRLFIGGLFGSVNGVAIADVAELDPTTGAAIMAFDFAFTGVAARGTFTKFSSGEIKHVEATPDGDTLVVVHRAAAVDGQTRSGYAIFDISNQAAPFLTSDHSNTFFTWPNCVGGALPTSGAVSPDGSYLVMGTLTLDLPACHDAVIAFPVRGGSDAPAKWAHQMRDSVFSVAVSDVAVYAGGHFCRIESGPSLTNDAGRDDKFCTGSSPNNHTDGAWRWQMAALHPTDGTPLDWDPGNNALRGANFMQATDRGLWFGFDGDRVNDILTGAFAELVIDPTNPVPPQQPAPDPEPVPDPDPIPQPDPIPENVFCLGARATIVGTNGNDVIQGTPENDVIATLDGNDIVHGLDGDDLVCGGRGNDRIWGGKGDDFLIGGRGRDRLWGEFGRDTILGNEGRDALLGGPGADNMNGGPGNDRLVGNSAADLMAGENGRDRLLGGPGTDTLRGGGGNDTLYGGDGVDSLNGGVAIDICRQSGGGSVRRCEIGD